MTQDYVYKQIDNKIDDNSRNGNNSNKINYYG